MAHQLNISDITDQKALDIAGKDANVDKWLTEVDNEFEFIQQQEDVETADLRATLHTIVKRYLVAYFCKIVFRDKMGAGFPDSPSNDVYKFKFDQYINECDKLRSAINHELLTDADTEIEPVDTIGGGVIWRG